MDKRDLGALIIAIVAIVGVIMYLHGDRDHPYYFKNGKSYIEVNDV